VLWGHESREESVYISGDLLHLTLYYWGLRVVVCDTQLTSRRHCWLRWLELPKSRGRRYKADENSPTLIPVTAVALCLQARRYLRSLLMAVLYPSATYVLLRNLLYPLFGLVADSSKTRRLPSALVELDARHEVDGDAVRAIPQVSNARPSKNNTTKPKEDEITEKPLPLDATVQTLP
jgi:hypothetical protein